MSLTSSMPLMFHAVTARKKVKGHMHEEREKYTLSLAYAVAFDFRVSSEEKTSEWPVRVGRKVRNLENGLYETNK